MSQADFSLQDLQVRVVELEQANDRLTSQCDRLQTELAQLRQENESFATLRERLRSKNTRSATKVAVSPSERRDRLLEVTATVASVLLTEKSLDEAVNTALQMIGEALDTDRVGVTDNSKSPSDSAVHWRVLYEWTSAYTVPQLSHPDLMQGSWG